MSIPNPIFRYLHELVGRLRKKKTEKDLEELHNISHHLLSNARDAAVTMRNCRKAAGSRRSPGISRQSRRRLHEVRGPEIMSDQKPTSEILAAALHSAGAPSCMIHKAEAGEYDDYKAKNTATPCMDLVRDLENAACVHPPHTPQRQRLLDLCDRAKKGEFDAQKWESDAWAKSMENDPEMGSIIKQMKAVWQ